MDCSWHHKALLVLVGQQGMVGRWAKRFLDVGSFLQGITQYRFEEMVSVWRHGCCWGWRYLEIKEHCGSNYPSLVLLLPALPHPGPMNLGIFLWGTKQISRHTVKAQILPFLKVNQISSVKRGNFLPGIDALASAKEKKPEVCDHLVPLERLTALRECDLVPLLITPKTSWDSPGNGRATKQIPFAFTLGFVEATFFCQSLQPEGSKLISFIKDGNIWVNSLGRNTQLWSLVL